MRDRNRRSSPADVRLVAEGTRVLVLKGDAPPYPAGVITDVRPQTHLKSYVVTCDDGAIVFASGSELAREGDSMAVPLATRRPQ